jgi:hypothetical protein
LPDASPIRRGEEYQQEFDEALLKVFLEHDVQPIPRARLVRLLREKLGWKDPSVRRRLDDSPWIDWTSSGENNMVGCWRDEPRDEPDAAIRQTKRRRIQEAARRLLASAPDKQMAGGTLSALIVRETGYARPLVYNALAAMPDITRTGQPGQSTYQLAD